MSDELKDTVRQIFVNPKAVDKIVTLINHDKPAGWSHHSNAPYYKRIYADEIRPFIDRMMVDKQDIVYKYSVWCTESTNISPQTVYNRVNQSIRWLIEKSPTSEEREKYASWYELVKVERVRNLGVRISFIPGFGLPSEGGELRPESVAPVSQKPVWERKMDEWIEDSDNYEPFVKEGLALTQDEIVDLKIRLNGLSNIQSSITQDRIALIRLG
jgi:hypothetical protein